MSLKLGMGCMNCGGLYDESKCGCINKREEDIQNMEKEVLKLKSLKAKIVAMEQIIDVLEQMTDTSITLDAVENQYLKD